MIQYWMFCRLRGPRVVEVLFRQAGDDWLLVEYGREMVLDYMLNFRVQAAVQEIESRKIEGLIENMPVFKTISYHFDPKILSMKDMLKIARDVELSIGTKEQIAKLEFKSNVVEMPLAFEESQTRATVSKYLKEIKAESVDYDPEHLSCLSYMALYNGITRDEFKRKLLQTEWFVFSVGFYIGMVEFIPLDLTCTLRTTKSNPPRTSTPRSEIGFGSFIGCIYSVPGPGGYHIIGRTSPSISLSQKHPDFKDEAVLLHVGDRIKFYDVPEDELVRIERAIDEGSPEFRYKKTPGVFRVGEWLEQNEKRKDEIEAWHRHQTEAASRAPVP